MLLSTIGASPAIVDNIVKACCVLHNFLIDETPRGAAHPGNAAATESWRSDVPDNGLQGLRGGYMRNRAPDEAHRVQNLLVNYFSNAGALEWQDDHIGFEA